MAEKRTTSAESGHLTPRQERALESLLSTVSHKQAAAQAGVSERSLRRYLADPVFQGEYRARRRQMMADATALAVKFSVDAVATLVTIFKDTDMPPSVRVSAANSVFGIADAGLKTEDVIARIEALEEMFNGQNGQLAKTPSQNGAGYASRKF
jgi:hypothetical protein